MDVNGTRFHLLVGRRDWSLPLSQGVSVTTLVEAERERASLLWDDATSSVMLKPLLFRFESLASSAVPRIRDRRGAARDRYGNWYWIAQRRIDTLIGPDDGSATEILYGSGDGSTEHFWSSDDLAHSHKADAGAFGPVETPALPATMRLRGLAVTEHHYLVVGTLQPAGLLIFDLHAGGAPLRIEWPEEIPFEPFDLTPTPGGGVIVLDRPSQSTDVSVQPFRYWELDRYFRLIAMQEAAPEMLTPDFVPASGPATPAGDTWATGVQPEMAVTIDLPNPIAIEALPDGSVLVVSNGLGDDPAVVTRYRNGVQVHPPLSLQKAVEGLLAPDHDETLRCHDAAFLPDPESTVDAVRGTLYVAASDGNQTFAFEYDGTQDGLVLMRDYFPMRNFGGKGIVAAGGTVYYDLGDYWLPLVVQPRARYIEEGTMESPVFDGKAPDCVWHRLFLDAMIPPGASIGIESRASNQEDLVVQMPWRQEPAPYMRGGGSEIPFYTPFSATESRQEGNGTWELLFQNAVGRYVQLRITLRGTGRNTPRLRALRAYYPRFSYLVEYLPALYRIDETSASFLDRFLSNVEGLYTAMEGRIEKAQLLFDVRTAGTEYLDWLAGWFGVMLEAGWDERRRRLFLSHALQLFNERGTPAGLIRSIRLAIDPCPDESLFTPESCDCAPAVPCGCGSSTSSARVQPYSIRIVERFLTRSFAGVVIGDPTELEGPGLVAESSTWQPSDGVSALHQRYRQFLIQRYGNSSGITLSTNRLSQAWGRIVQSFTDVQFSPVLPANAREAADWRAFTAITFDFSYPAIQASNVEEYRWTQRQYQRFLSRRYGDITQLNAAYGLSGEDAWASFEEITLPAENDMPIGGARLVDWLHFVSFVLSVARNAHRFTVLVPTTPGASEMEQARQLELVEQIVELERPAHTAFTVKQYWALFRVGEARLGYDTLLDRGSRFTALVLGSNNLTESYLASSHPWNVPDRIVAGRDTAGHEL